jgi:hypothetical protein
MLVTRTSIITGVTRTLDLPVTEEQLTAHKSGTHAQNAFSDLSADLREFIISGVTPEEWDKLFEDQADDI